MASFVSIQVSSANATLGPWSVVSLDPYQRFLDLFSSIQAGKYSIIRTSSELPAAVLESVCIGSDKSNLSRVEKDLNVAEVCASFYFYFTFRFTILHTKMV